MPVLITLGILIMAGLLALGVWAILRGADQPEPVPTAARTQAVATSAAATDGPRTSAVVTSAAPAAVVVPPVRQLPAADARQALTAFHLVVTVVQRPDPDLAAGLAIGTEPGQGASLAPGSAITLIVSSGPPEAPPTTAPAPESPAEPTTAAPTT